MRRCLRVVAAAAVLLPAVDAFCTLAARHSIYRTPRCSSSSSADQDQTRGYCGLSTRRSVALTMQGGAGYGGRGGDKIIVDDVFVYPAAVWRRRQDAEVSLMLYAWVESCTSSSAHSGCCLHPAVCVCCFMYTVVGLKPACAAATEQNSRRQRSYIRSTISCERVYTRAVCVSRIACDSRAAPPLFAVVARCSMSYLFVGLMSCSISPSLRNRGLFSNLCLD